MLLSKLLSRNHHSRLWRSLLVLVVASALMLIQTPAVSAAPFTAGNDGNGGTAITAVDALCIDGLVINHQERPLEGWTVTASYVGTDGTAEPQTAVSDKNGTFHFDLPVPGRWLFSIAIPSDWKAVTDASFEVNVAYGSSDCVDIRFKVEQEITVIVLKIDDDHHPLEGWTIIATPGPGNPFNDVHTAVTDAEGKATFVLPPGPWIFSEQAPAGVTWWRPIMPPDGVQELIVRAPGPYTIRFKNDVKVVDYGCIEVTKRDVPPASDKGGQSESFGLPDWPIEVLRVNGSIAAEGLTDAFGQITFSDLPFGPYLVREIMLPGWEAVTPTAFEVVLTRADDGCQVIEFQNKQTEKGFCVEGVKQDINGLYGIPGWKISAKPLDTGGVVVDSVVTDGQGKYRIDFPFDDYRIPGSTYEISEETRDGWSAVGQTSYTVTLPKYPGACVQVPPFVNRQTNDEHPQPQPHQPKHNQGNHNQGNRNEGRQWQPEGLATCSAYHTVRRGEGLYSIAPQYGTNGQALLNANPWVRGQRHHWLYVGQKVCIP
ncbi:MAG: LysM peptidoglycan-binding domain-containing protein [Caldilineaceae bacterium]|nr:LysM peptidoglycan-binding domain-containing protein [Caldilineaceae bacterium]